MVPLKNETGMRAQKKGREPGLGLILKVVAHFVFGRFLFLVTAVVYQKIKNAHFVLAHFVLDRNNYHFINVVISYSLFFLAICFGGAFTK